MLYYNSGRPVGSYQLGYAATDQITCRKLSIYYIRRNILFIRSCYGEREEYNIVSCIDIRGMSSRKLGIVASSEVVMCYLRLMQRFCCRMDVYKRTRY